MHKEELYEMLCDELDKIAGKGELTAGSLDTVDKLTHSIKSLATIMATEDSGYSNEGGYNSYAGGNSYARNGRGGNRGGRGGYSRARGYSRRYSMDDGKEHIMEQLEDIMEDAPDAKTRKAIEKALMQLND